MTDAEAIELLGLPVPTKEQLRIPVNDRIFKILMLLSHKTLTEQAQGAEPTTTNPAVAPSPAVTSLRNSTTPKKALVYNHGPNAVHVNFGAANATINGSSVKLDVDDAYETPNAVVGKITAICAVGENAAITLTLF